MHSPELEWHWNQLHSWKGHAVPTVIILRIQDWITTSREKGPMYAMACSTLFLVTEQDIEQNTRIHGTCRSLNTISCECNCHKMLTKYFYYDLCTDLVVEKVAWDDLLFWPCHDCMVLPMLGSADRPNHILIRGWSRELRLDFP